MRNLQRFPMLLASQAKSLTISRVCRCCCKKSMKPSTVSMFFENVSFSRRKPSTHLGVSPFFQRQVTSFICTIGRWHLKIWTGFQRAPCIWQSVPAVSIRQSTQASGRISVFYVKVDSWRSSHKEIWTLFQRAALMTL